MTTSVYSGLSLKRASAVLYLLTTDAGLHERIAINRIRLVNLALLLGQDLKNTKKWMKRPCLVTIWTWKWYKNGKNDTKSKKKRSFWRSTIFDHLPPCGFVNFINFIKTPLYFFFLGTTLILGENPSEEVDEDYYYYE